MPDAIVPDDSTRHPLHALTYQRLIEELRLQCYCSVSLTDGFECLECQAAHHIERLSGLAPVLRKERNDARRQYRAAEYQRAILQSQLTALTSANDVRRELVDEMHEMREALSHVGIDYAETVGWIVHCEPEPREFGDLKDALNLLGRLHASQPPAP